MNDQLQKYLPVLQRWFPLKRVQWLIALLLVIWIASSLANLAWVLLPKLLGSDAGSIVDPVKIGATSQPKISRASLASIKLFGDGKTNSKGVGDASGPQVAAPAGEAPDDAPHTSLPLTLTGVISAGDSPASVAFIKHQGKEARYRIDDKLPPNNQAVLVRFFPEHVIISNGGRYESIKLYNDDPNKPQLASLQQPRTVKPKGALDKNGAAVSALNKNDKGPPLERFKKMVQNNDIRAIQKIMSVRVKKDENGVQQGFEVKPGRERDIFNALGLKSGDLISKVNGIDVNENPAQLSAMQSQLSSASSFDLTVIRGGEPVDLSIDLN